MKKIICILLVLCLLILSGCGSDSGKNKVQVSPVMQEYLDSLHEFEVPVREYGEAKSQTFFSEKLMVGVFYPHIGIEDMDNAIEQWVRKTIGDYQVETSTEEFSNGGCAELTVDYRSYLVGEKYVSVKLSGIHMSPNMAHPVELVATFNGNLETGEYLSVDDVLNFAGKETVKRMLVKKAGVELDQWTDEDGLLDNWLLRSNGIDFVLPQGEFLPMSDGTKTVSVTYDELKGLLKIKDITAEQSVTEDFSDSQGGTVQQNPDDKNSPLDSSAPMIALTFDDGPSANTERLLKIFKKYGGKGTFFVVGNIIDNRTDIIKKMAAEGHDIGGHGWSHRQLTNLSEEEVKDQIMSTRAKIYHVSGVDTKLVRPPYGAVNDSVLELAKELDVAMINWSVDTDDWKTKDADKIYKHIMNKANDGAIILCHDLYKTTVDAMEKAIPALIKKGYRLVTVSELIESKGRTVTAGKVYYRGY